MKTTVTEIKALPQIQKRKRTAAYARVSSDKDATRHSLSAQISYYNEYIGRHIEWDFAGVYADEPTTGTKDNRREFRRMLDDCRAGKIDMIVTKSVTRFARNTVTTLETVRELKSLGIDVFFEKENIHSVGGDGELMLTILASFAQEESRSVSENCKWRIRKMFQAGRPTHTRLLGYRWVEGIFRIVPEEAETVRQIFANYLAGMGKTAIAKKLNAAGVSTMNGGPWNENTVRNILLNEKYVGDLVLQKFFIANHISKAKRVNRGELPMYRVEGSHEAIMERDTFDAVRLEMQRRAAICKPPRKQCRPYPFTGLLRCARCGRFYKRKLNAAGTKYEKAVWICPTFNSIGKRFCPSRQIPEDILSVKTSKLLGIADVNREALVAAVSEIRVTEACKLLFAFRDGRIAEVEWQNSSRSESWTEEMKRTARERQLKISKERKKTT
ncbi:MAG: recombinase family protein [Treponema sp.]|nr:recombinase family protein [Treponema sp.]